MWWLVCLLVLGWVALGPVAAVLVGGLLAVPRVRAAVQVPQFTRKGAAVSAGIAVVVATAVLLVPDGRLPVPQLGGVLLTPAYEGRPAMPQPVALDRAAAGVGAAPVDRATSRGGVGRFGTVEHGGPLGESPVVSSHSYGLEQCADIVFDARSRLVVQCGEGGSRGLRVIDPDTLTSLSALDLPGGPDRMPTACARPTFHLDASDRVVVPAADGRILAVRTTDPADSSGEPDLEVVESWSLGAALAPGDCLVGVLPAPDGRLWFASARGTVGTLLTGSGTVRKVRLDEPVQQSFALTPEGDAVVVTDRALYRVHAEPDGQLRVAWRRVYDRGTRTKPGQLSQGSGTAPVLLDGGVVAIADNSEPRMNVVAYGLADGRERCKVPVFEDDRGATSSGLVALGDSVLVQNNHGYRSPRSTWWGLGTETGMARVRLTGECQVEWENDLAAPNATPVASLETGLVYTWTKHRSLWGVNAWYLTAVDLRTGRTRYEVRGGLGQWSDSAHAGLALAPDGTAHVPVRGGFVRVEDRTPGQ